jgi:RNA polymerase-interacting CarD/CdnL/TRCF family regulator
MSYDTGDTIVHARYGAGKVLETRTLAFSGEEKSYVCIELADDRGTLMIPQEEFEEEELRPAMTDTQTIRRVFESEPQPLSDNHRSRQGKIDKMIKSGNPNKIAQALRDLAWREAIHKLTATDSRLKGDAMKRLAEEFALSPKVTIAGIRKRITTLLSEAIDKHQASEQAQPAS